MGRELRRVPEGWEHPKNYAGNYIPLCDSDIYYSLVEDFEEMLKEKGIHETLKRFEGGPNPNEYMLVDVPKEKRTKFQMYENTSEGTPISPVFDTSADLCSWLVENNASWFADFEATYEQWMSVVNEKNPGFHEEKVNGINCVFF